MAASADQLRSRLARLRADVRTAQLDALVVSNLTNVRYLTGFHGSAGALVITDRQCALVVDFRYASSARLAAHEHAGGLEVVVADAVIDDAGAAILHDCAVQRIGVESHWLSLARFNRLTAQLGQPRTQRSSSTPTLVPTERLVERARAVKDAWEIATLREAARRLAAAAAEVPALARPGRRETEVAEDIDALLKGAGFERPAFETIVASGPNAALPHARPSQRRLARDEGAVLDFGGVYDGYCVDLTRTVAIGTPPAQWQRTVAAVCAAQRAAIAVVRPGVLASRVDAAAREVLADHGLAEAFGHATGHGIGLEVHEEPRIGRPVWGQDEYVLEPGMVFTVEPGVYVEGVGGARVEDDVLVTEIGCDVLTRA